MPSPYIISGFADEVSDDLAMQIRALKELGWSSIDLRTVKGKNVSSLSDAEFDAVHRQLEENGIAISCFGSTIANWSRDAYSSVELDLAEMRTSIRHMNKANVRFIRIMSYKIDSPVNLGSSLEDVIFSNLKKIVRIAEDHGIVCLHENCETWGGQSSQHTLRLLERVNSPALKLVFDTGNPVSMLDVRDQEPFSYQDSLKFFSEVREHVAYLHIKDGCLNNDTLRYTAPGKGAGKVKEILRLVSEYDMAMPISIEPHVSVVFHDPSKKASFEQRWNSFIEYGNQLVAIAEEAGITFSSNRVT